MSIQAFCDNVYLILYVQIRYMRIFYFRFFVQFLTFPIKKGKFLVYFYDMGEDCGTSEDFPYQSANHPKACFPICDFLEQ